MICVVFLKALFFNSAEKDDLVNLLMRHAGNSSNNTQRSDFPSDHSSRTDMESGNQSSVMHDRTEQLFQEQSTSTAPYVSAQCVPSTSETPPDSDYLVNSLYNNTSFGKNYFCCPLNTSVCMEVQG
jgi:hypothetical protein